MEDPFVDVPVFIVMAHFVALLSLSIHIGVIYLRRFVIIRQSRGLPSTIWFRLLQVLLGLTK